MSPHMMGAATRPQDIALVAESAGEPGPGQEVQPPAGGCPAGSGGAEVIGRPLASISQMPTLDSTVTNPLRVQQSG